MKYYIFIFFCSFIIHINAQNWQIIRPNEKYNFTVNDTGFITSTIWTDSLLASGSDTTFYLNRIVVDSDTNQNYAFYNQPQFLQKECFKTDSSYFFKSPEQFAIYPFLDNWLFDTTNLIEASVVKKNQEIIFGANDSIKYIALTTGDTIVMSKTYGIIRYDDPYTDNSYQLKGIQGAIGDHVPMFKDIFDFEVGDVFYYWGGSQYFMEHGDEYKEIITITSKYESADTLEYSVNVLKYLMEYSGPWFQGKDTVVNYESTLTYVDSFKHCANAFPNQMLKISDYQKEVFVDEYEYTVLNSSLDSLGIYTKTVGNIQLYNFFLISDSINNVFYRHFGPFDEHMYVYKKGLGQVKYANEGFEHSAGRRLMAYKKGGITVGIIPDTFYVSTKQYENFHDINIYPNPANSFFQISSSNEHNIQSVGLYNLNGQLQKMTLNKTHVDISDLSPGLYIVRIQMGEAVISRKLIISYL